MSKWTMDDMKCLIEERFKDYCHEMNAADSSYMSWDPDEVLVDFGMYLAGE